MSEEKKDLRIETWFEEARKIKTFDELLVLLKKLVAEPHDYNSVVYAVSAGVFASATAINRELKNRSLTGFQAGFIPLLFLQYWLSLEKSSGISWRDYDDMLYPQYEHNFEKTINLKTWESLQEKAKKLLKEKTSAHPAVISHWQSIVNGNVPFNYFLRED